MRSLKTWKQTIEECLGGDFCWSVFGSHPVFAGETKTVVFRWGGDGPNPEFSVSERVFFGDLIKAVRGLEGGSSKDGFQTSFFSTSNLYGFAQYVLYFLPGFLFDIEIEKPWCIELIPACNNGGATTDELLFLPFWKVAILGGTQEKTAPWLTTSRCWHPLGGCPWGALVQNGTIPGEMNS